MCPCSKCTNFGINAIGTSVSLMFAVYLVSLVVMKVVNPENKDAWMGVGKSSILRVRHSDNSENGDKGAIVLFSRCKLNP